MSRSCVAVSILLLVGGLACWLRFVEPIRRHGEFCRHVRHDLESLATKRPSGVTQKQWEHVVAWTLNAHGNCLTFHTEIPQNEMDRFKTELKQRLAGPVSLQTVDWIWDEIVRLTPNGQQYSTNWRPTLPERLKVFEQGNSTWGIKVD